MFKLYVLVIYCVLVIIFVDEFQLEGFKTAIVIFSFL